MAISFSYQLDSFELENPDKIKKWITRIINDAHCRVGTIGYLFCSDEFLFEANVKYLNHDTLTDIITFDYVESNLISGDIMISVDRVGENARLFDVSFEQELHRVIIHGILHLLGQGDKSDIEAAEMRDKENAALQIWETME